MNGTPRLRSSYPPTPDSIQRSSASNGARTGERGPRRTLSALPKSDTSTSTINKPLIPLTVIDAPSQRFYVCALYILLLGWRLWDWSRLVEDEADSFWLFIKWVALDGVFLFGLPGMRIPWLEWPNTATTGIFFVHAILNGMLMFRIPIPIEAWLAVLVKTIYDSELSVSENRVKPANILHNSSLIMGKQIINVLPEGSATLNPNRLSFCIDRQRPTAQLPIRLNQTLPALIELLRMDFDSNTNETIAIRSKELKVLMKQAAKMQPKSGKGELILEYEVKRPGIYRLQHVLDDSNLEVQRRMSDTLVVTCPKATIKSTTADKCIGDLSDLTIQVDGTPPLKIVYSRTINKEDESFHFQSIQPKHLVSPLLGSNTASTLVLRGDEDISWGRSHTIDVRLNESMATSGTWLYSIDEIHDAVGNVANFSDRGQDGEHMYAKGTHLEHSFIIHERPVAYMDGCDTRNPLRVARGKSHPLPVKFGPFGKSASEIGHTITWLFSPIDSLTANSEHGDSVITEEFVATSPRRRHEIHRPGLYTLKSVSNQFCAGDIKEPSSCLLLNPPEPSLTITSEDIYDKCAGNAIGLLVNMDLVGTPPFELKYEVEQNKKIERRLVKIVGSRHQLELRPRTAGHFKYTFTGLTDDVYHGYLLKGEGLDLEQDVKPPAFAYFTDTHREVRACIDEAVEFDVELKGEPPFALEYELVHEGKRSKRLLADIKKHIQKISTDPLIHGGEYSLALISVQDTTGCKIPLNEEVKINVRRQKPKASFALLEGKRSTMTLEGNRIGLPLRLEGEAPWAVSYRNMNESAGKILHEVTHDTNHLMKVDRRGVYEIVNVSDKYCPGTVDETTATFSVEWIARPEIRLVDSVGVLVDEQKHTKREVCEGDTDAIEISLSGTPPFHLRYKQHHEPGRGSRSVSNKEITAALGVITVAMDTTKAGVNTYEFFELWDHAYDHDPKHSPFLVEQTVNPKPSAQFTKPGQSYKYCKEEESGDEVIPITLHGVPPFYLELDIKHQSSSRPETVKLANIESNRYDFRIPHRVLSLGTHHVSVRKVRDSRGCQLKTEYGAPHVQVQVFDVPTIYALESRTDYCVGDRISYTLSGAPPFDIYYTFGAAQKKAKSPNTNFRRIAEKPGNFTITAISDRSSECKAPVEIMKTIHEMPSVKISKGRQVSVDIHEGGEAQIHFEFWGTPPFEFTYTRSTNARKGHKSQVLETKHDISYEHNKVVQASQEGTYEVVAIKDKFCAFSKQRVEVKSRQKLLQH